MRYLLSIIFAWIWILGTAQSVEKGVLDLRKYDFGASPVLSLEGEWLFSWEQLSPESDFIYAQVPSDWRNFEIKGKKLPSFGYASYRLRILLPKNCPDLAFRFEAVGSAAQYFVNGKMLHHQGEFSKSFTENLAKNVAVVPFSADSTVDLVVYVSNFVDFYPAIWTAPKLGVASYMREDELKNIVLEAFLAGSIFIMALYHIGLFWKRRKDLSALYFGIFCFWIALRTLVRGEILAEKLFSWGYFLVMRLDYLTFYASLPSCLLFFGEIFPLEISRKILKFIVYFSLAFCGLALFSPIYWLAQSLNIFQLFTILAGFYGIFVLFKASFKQRPYAFLVFGGGILLFSTAVIDILYANGILSFGNFISFGLFIFIFIQAFVLSINFSESYFLAESLTSKLAEQNKILEATVAQKTHDLTLANKILESQNAEIALKANELDVRNIELKTLLAELKNAQDQLIQSEKMASLGQLTAGIVHEINNPVNFISAGVSSLNTMFEDIKELLLFYEKIEITEENLSKKINKLKKEIHYQDLLQDMDDMFKDVQFGVKRTVEIIASIRTFSRTDNKSLSLINVQENLNGALIILKNQYKHRIDIVREYDENLPQIYCFSGNINQVFVNILGNAMQAIPEDVHGIIKISTQSISPKEAVDWHLPKNFDGIVVQIEDSGVGIAAENLEKIFERNFTTKSADKGTGLGLSISKEIVEAHQGCIKVSSVVGKGTTFSIFLPIQPQF